MMGLIEKIPFNPPISENEMILKQKGTLIHFYWINEKFISEKSMEIGTRWTVFLKIKPAF